MQLDVKICGLKEPETITAALELGASHVGFVFFDKSPRHLSLAQAAGLRDLVGAAAKIVAVVVDADNRFLDDLVHQVRPDILQLHGRETPRRAAEIKRRYHLPIAKAIAVHDKSDLQNLVPYRDIADRLLFDAKAPKDSHLPGGNGVAFDWKLLDGLDSELNYMLSGGLNAQNIVQALKQARPGGVDVSSGVERAPGLKDIGLMRDFFAALDKGRQVTED